MIPAKPLDLAISNIKYCLEKYYIRMGLTPPPKVRVCKDFSNPSPPRDPYVINKWPLTTVYSKIYLHFIIYSIVLVSYCNICAIVFIHIQLSTFYSCSTDDIAEPIMCTAIQIHQNNFKNIIANFKKISSCVLLILCLMHYWKYGLPNY